VAHPSEKCMTRRRATPRLSGKCGGTSVSESNKNNDWIAPVAAGTFGIALGLLLYRFAIAGDVDLPTMCDLRSETTVDCARQWFGVAAAMLGGALTLVGAYIAVKPSWRQIAIQADAEIKRELTALRAEREQLVVARQVIEFIVSEHLIEEFFPSSDAAFERDPTSVVDRFMRTVRAARDSSTERRLHYDIESIEAIDRDRFIAATTKVVSCLSTLSEAIPDALGNSDPRIAAVSIVARSIGRDIHVYRDALRSTDTLLDQWQREYDRLRAKLST